MADLYIVDFGGDEQERARREAEREAERRRLADHYLRYLVASTGVDQAASRKVITMLFDPRDADGNRCPCSCHPQLSADHGDGFDCQCTWDEDRRAAEAVSRQARWDSREAATLSAAHQREEDTIAGWLAGQAGVDARRTSSYAPEQWEGAVDGRTFYFRERGGMWRIELDMMPSGRYAQRLAQVGEDRASVTAPVPIMEGEVIAEGLESDLGAGPVDHIAFIVAKIHDHLRAAGCEHQGARRFCPDCGQRTGTGS